MIDDRNDTFADRVRAFVDGSEDGRTAIDESRNLLQKNEIREEQ